jgi:hypothetical protein
LYLRHSVRRKNGKQHTYWRLVRALRRGGKVVQETVAQLGELEADGRANARLLAQQITGADQQQRELFEAAASAEQRIAVRLDRVCIERARWFGGVWLGWKLWRALKLDELCAELMPPGREAIPWAQMAAVLVIARLTEPASELHIAEDWYRRARWKTCWGCRASGSTAIASTARWIGCWRTSRRSSSICAAGLASCSRSSTTCCSTM